VKGRKIINQSSGNWKKVGESILISVKEDFKSKLIRRDKEGHYVLINGTIQKIKWLQVYMHQMLEHPISNLSKGTDSSRYNKMGEFKYHTHIPSFSPEKNH
jgi:hypothetical protein